MTRPRTLATGRLVAAALVLTLTIAATADTTASALAGRYSRNFANGLVSGEKYRSDDVVEIVPVDARHAYVRFALQFFNGHSCSLSGVAQAQGDALVYRAPAGQSFAENCTLTIRRDGTKLAWNDGEGTCKAYCGNRGSFEQGSLPWASKRAIRYLPRLKGSREYRTALTEWRTGRGVRP